MRKKVSKELLVARTPVRPLFYSKPALLLEEIQEDDLAKKLLCEVGCFDSLFLKVISNDFLVLENGVERITDLLEKLLVLLEKLLSDLFDVKGTFNIG